MPAQIPDRPVESTQQRLQRLGYFYVASTGEEYGFEGYWSTKLDHELVHLRGALADWDYAIPKAGGSDRAHHRVIRVACGVLLTYPDVEPELRSHDINNAEAAIKGAMFSLVTRDFSKVTCPECRVKCDELLEKVVYVRRVGGPEPKE